MGQSARTRHRADSTCVHSPSRVLRQAVVAALAGRRLARIEPSRLARAYLVAVAIVVAARGVRFVLFGYGKLASMDFMVKFFADSGYSVAFLQLIAMTELLGGIALLCGRALWWSPRRSD